MNIWPWSSKPPTKEQFGRLMIDAIAKSAGGPAPTLDLERFCITPADGKAHRLFLDNAFQIYCRATNRKERAECLRRFAATFRDIDPDAKDEPFSAVGPNLLPRVRERLYHTLFALQVEFDRLADPKPDVPEKPVTDMFALRPFNQHLTVELVQDMPDSIRSVSPPDLTFWGQTFESAMAVARDNLWARSNENFQQILPGLFMSPWRDTHDCSRLFLHDLIWQLPVQGKHVAAIPNRDVLLVTGDENEAGLIMMAEIAGKVLDDPRPMTGRFFRLEDRTWTPFVPPKESATYGPIHGLAIRSAAREYGEQQHWLRKIFEKTGRDCFVAGLTAMRRPDGSLFTWTTWVDKVDDALLPEADFVSFGSVVDGKAEQRGVATWERVVAAAGHRLEKTDLDPVRYQIRTFPSDEELDAMGMNNVPG